MTGAGAATIEHKGCGFRTLRGRRGIAAAVFLVDAVAVSPAQAQIATRASLSAPHTNHD